MQFTTLLIDDIMLISVCLLDDLILSFYRSIVTLGIIGFELELTITLALQWNQLANIFSLFLLL